MEAYETLQEFGQGSDGDGDPLGTTFGCEYDQSVPFGCKKTFGCEVEKKLCCATWPGVVKGSAFGEGTAEHSLDYSRVKGELSVGVRLTVGIPKCHVCPTLAEFGITYTFESGNVHCPCEPDFAYTSHKLVIDATILLIIGMELSGQIWSMHDSGDREKCHDNRPNLCEWEGCQGQQLNLLIEGKIELYLLFTFDLLSGKIFYTPGELESTPTAEDITCPESHPFCCTKETCADANAGWCYYSDSWTDGDYHEAKGRGFCENHNPSHKTCDSTYNICEDGWCYQDPDWNCLSGCYSDTRGRVRASRQPHASQCALPPPS